MYEFIFRSDQGTIWKRATISLSSDKPFEIVIEGFVGDGYRGDIALDDLSLTSNCIEYSGSLPVEPVIPTTVIPTNPHSCSSNQFNCYRSGTPFSFFSL